MLSEQERREMLEMTKSAAVREEFRRLKTASQLPKNRPVDLDGLMDFLTTMTRFSGRPLPPRPFVHYSNVRL